MMKGFSLLRKKIAAILLAASAFAAISAGAFAQEQDGDDLIIEARNFRASLDAIALISKVQLDQCVRNDGERVATDAFQGTEDLSYGGLIHLGHLVSVRVRPWSEINGILWNDRNTNRRPDIDAITLTAGSVLRGQFVPYVALPDAQGIYPLVRYPRPENLQGATSNYQGYFPICSAQSADAAGDIPQGLNENYRLMIESPDGYPTVFFRIGEIPANTAYDILKKTFSVPAPEDGLFQSITNPAIFRFARLTDDLTPLSSLERKFGEAGELTVADIAWAVLNADSTDQVAERTVEDLADGQAISIEFEIDPGYPALRVFRQEQLLLMDGTPPNTEEPAVADNEQTIGELRADVDRFTQQVEETIDSTAVAPNDGGVAIEKLTTDLNELAERLANARGAAADAGSETGEIDTLANQVSRLIEQLAAASNQDANEGNETQTIADLHAHIAELTRKLEAAEAEADRAKEAEADRAKEADLRVSELEELVRELTRKLEAAEAETRRAEEDTDRVRKWSENALKTSNDERDAAETALVTALKDAQSAKDQLADAVANLPAHDVVIQLPAWLHNALADGAIQNVTLTQSSSATSCVYAPVDVETTARALYYRCDVAPPYVLDIDGFKAIEIETSIASLPETDVRLDRSVSIDHARTVPSDIVVSNVDLDNALSQQDPELGLVSHDVLSGETALTVDLLNETARIALAKRITCDLTMTFPEMSPAQYFAGNLEAVEKTNCDFFHHPHESLINLPGSKVVGCEVHGTYCIAQTDSPRPNLTVSAGGSLQAAFPLVRYGNNRENLTRLVNDFVTRLSPQVTDPGAIDDLIKNLTETQTAEMARYYFAAGDPCDRPLVKYQDGTVALGPIYSADCPFDARGPLDRVTLLVSDSASDNIEEKLVYSSSQTSGRYTENPEEPVGGGLPNDPDPERPSGQPSTVSGQADGISWIKNFDFELDDRVEIYRTLDSCQDGKDVIKDVAYEDGALDFGEALPSVFLRIIGEGRVKYSCRLIDGENILRVPFTPDKIDIRYEPVYAIAPATTWRNKFEGPLVSAIRQTEERTRSLQIPSDVEWLAIVANKGGEISVDKVRLRGIGKVTVDAQLGNHPFDFQQTAVAPIVEEIDRELFGDDTASDDQYSPIILFIDLRTTKIDRPSSHVLNSLKAQGRDIFLVTPASCTEGTDDCPCKDKGVVDLELRDDQCFELSQSAVDDDPKQVTRDLSDFLFNAISRSMEK